MIVAKFVLCAVGDKSKTYGMCTYIHTIVHIYVRHIVVVTKLILLFTYVILSTKIKISTVINTIGCLWLLYFISIYRLAIIPTFFLNLHCNAMNLYDLLHLFLLQNITKCRICTSIWIISIIRLLYYASPLMPQNFDLHAFRSAKHQCWITFEVSHTHKHFIHT